MNTMDRETLNEWLDLEMDGQLAGPRRARLQESLARDPELMAERRRLESLHALIIESRIDVREGFAGRVMAGLPATAWQPSPAPVWALPMAMMVVLGLAASLVLGTAVPTEGLVAGTGLAVFDFLKATALAGSGLVAASWRGLGLGLEELISSSGLSLAAMAVMVLCLNLLFFSLLRRRPHEIRPILENALASEGKSAPEEKS